MICLRWYPGRLVEHDLYHLPPGSLAIPGVRLVLLTGYSLMEDVTLSLRVGRKWKLANVREARIFHDSQPGQHKSDLRVLAKMEIINRHYVVRNILGQCGLVPLLRLGLWQAFSGRVGGGTAVHPAGYGLYPAWPSGCL